MAEESSSKSLRLSDEGLRILKEREGGFYAKPYPDSGGLAIGYGMQTWKGKKVTPDLRITQQEADEEIRRQADQQYGAIVRNALTVPVSQSQYDALVSLAYNSPKAAIGLANKLNAGKILTEADFKASGTVEGQKHPALQSRRKQEYEQFSSVSPNGDEKAFRDWYGRMAKQYDLASDPDDPESFYDYRAAFRAGARPDASGHWPSDFKRVGHPNEIVGGFNTRTGERVAGTKRASESELVRMGWDADTAKQLAALPEPQYNLVMHGQEKAPDTPSGDPLFVLLNGSELATAQKRGVWDLYQAAKNPDDLAARLKDLQIPNGIKRDLWNLKADEMQSTASKPSVPSEPYVLQPSTSQSSDRWKNFDPYGLNAWEKGEGPMPMLIPGEAASATAALAKASAQKGLSVAQRAASAVGEVAVPVLKYEAVKGALQAIGVPWYVADATAYMITGRRGGKGAAAAEGEATAAAKASEAATATKPAAAAEELTPLGFPKPTEKPLTPLELTRKLRAEHQAKMAAEAAKAAPAEPVAPASTPRGPLGTPSFAQEVKKFSKSAVEETAKQGKPLLTTTEVSRGMKLMRDDGLTAEEALKRILAERSLPKAWRGLPSDEEMKRVVTQTNQTGRMTRPQ